MLHIRKAAPLSPVAHVQSLIRSRSHRFSTRSHGILSSSTTQMSGQKMARSRLSSQLVTIPVMVHTVIVRIPFAGI